MSQQPSYLIEAISHHIYSTLLFTYQQHPQWLNAKFRQYPWDKEELQIRLTQKIVKKLQIATDSEKLFTIAIQLLQQSLTAQFFLSKDFLTFLSKLHSYTHSPLEDSHNLSPPISILLVDAENIPLDVEMEKLLTNLSPYPLQIKIAFANWKSLGKKDAYFHGRGYELIHVPVGKNSADIKMTAIGSSILIDYPNVQEVFLCSSDGDFNHLFTTLQRHGLTVHWVSRKADNVKIINSKTGEVETYSLSAIATPKSLEQLLEIFKLIIGNECHQTQENWIKISRIGIVFAELYKVKVNQVIAEICPGKTLKDILSEHSSDFVIHHPPNGVEYVTVFGLDIQTPEAPALQPEIVNEKPVHSSGVSFTSKKDIETALAKIVQKLSQKSPQKKPTISEVHSVFQKQYGQSVKNSLGSLNVKMKFSTFLQKSPRFELENTKKGWLVGIVLSQSQNP